jgi:hypothetical protein
MHADTRRWEGAGRAGTALLLQSWASPVLSCQSSSSRELSAPCAASAARPPSLGVRSSERRRPKDVAGNGGCFAAKTRKRRKGLRIMVSSCPQQSFAPFCAFLRPTRPPSLCVRSSQGRRLPLGTTDVLPQKSARSARGCPNGELRFESFLRLLPFDFAQGLGREPVERRLFAANASPLPESSHATDRQ